MLGSFAVGGQPVSRLDLLRRRVRGELRNPVRGVRGCRRERDRDHDLLLCENVMTEQAAGGRRRWAWIFLLEPPLVLFGTYSGSSLAPLGWIGAALVLATMLVVASRSARH